jgi:hypothetical protein
MDWDARWKKSTLTEDHECVELAWTGSTVGIRDSKAPDAGTLTVPAPALTHLLSHTKQI